MSTTRTRIARLAAASALALGLGALGAGPALATGTWAGSVPDSVTFAVDDDASPDTSHHGIHSTLAAEDGATTDAEPADEAPNGQLNAI